MGVASKAGDYAFKTLITGLGLATIYLTATFSVNVYRGLAWHNAQQVLSLPIQFLVIGSILCDCFDDLIIYKGKKGVVVVEFE